MCERRYVIFCTGLLVEQTGLLYVLVETSDKLLLPLLLLTRVAMLQS